MTDIDVAVVDQGMDVLQHGGVWIYCLASVDHFGEVPSCFMLNPLLPTGTSLMCV